MTAVSDTVAVGCKLPNGLILDVMDEHNHRTRIGILKGVAIDRTPGAIVPILHHGAAITHVSREGFLKWWEQNAKNDLVLQKAVFMQDTAPKAASEAKELEGIRPVFDPVTIKDAPKSGVKGVTDLAEGDKKDA